MSTGISAQKENSEEYKQRWQQTMLGVSYTPRNMATSSYFVQIHFHHKNVIIVNIFWWWSHTLRFEMSGAIILMNGSTMNQAVNIKESSTFDGNKIIPPVISSVALHMIFPLKRYLNSHFWYVPSKTL